MGRESRRRVVAAVYEPRILFHENRPSLDQRSEWLVNSIALSKSKLAEPTVHTPHVQFFDRGFFGSRKRSALMMMQANIRKEQTDFFSLLPDEILTEIFGFIPSARDRAVCSLICKRWLMLQSQMRRSFMKTPCEIFANHDQDVSRNSPRSVSDGVMKATEERVSTSFSEFLWDKKSKSESLSRCLYGKKATDVRLASIAVGTSSSGGLERLSIRGGQGECSAKAVSNFGLSAIATSCGGLKLLSIWDCPNIGNQGLISIGRGCGQLQKLDLIKCPSLGNEALEAIATGCPLLSMLSLDSCALIGNKGLTAVGTLCVNLISLSVMKCPLIGDEGVRSVVLNCKSLSFLKLDEVPITDNGLRLVGEHGSSLTKLILSDLKNVTEEGFIILKSSSVLAMLKHLCVSSCKGVTDNSLPVIGGVCKNLKVFSLSESENVTCEGLEAFARVCRSLEVFRLEKCQNVKVLGLKSSAGYSLENLKAVHVNRCNGLFDVRVCAGTSPPCFSLKTLSITDCKGIGNEFLQKIRICCPYLEKLNLSGLSEVSDAGVVAILQGIKLPLSSVNVSGCKQLTNKAVCAVAMHSGCNLQSLYLDGCENVTDTSIKVVAEKCFVLEDLDLSHCRVTDIGVAAVLDAICPTLETLSLAGCRRITDKCLCIIQNLCQSLSALNLQGCTNLSTNALESFKSHMWGCDILSA